MKVRYQADADLNEDIVAGVHRRAPGIDFQTADEAELANLPDPDVLALAAQEGRILVTHDRRTMPTHFGKFVEKNSSPGLIVISQKTDILSAIEGLILIWTASEAEEYVKFDSHNSNMNKTMQPLRRHRLHHHRRRALTAGTDAGHL